MRKDEGRLGERLVRDTGQRLAYAIRLEPIVSGLTTEVVMSRLSHLSKASSVQLHEKGKFVGIQSALCTEASNTRKHTVPLNFLGDLRQDFCGHGNRYSGLDTY